MGQFSKTEPVAHQLFEGDARAQLPKKLEGQFALLLVGDMHIHPFDNSKCIVWLSRLIDEIKPPTVAFLGDVADMDRLHRFRDNFHSDFSPKDQNNIVIQYGQTSLQDLVDAEITKVREKIGQLKRAIGRNGINAFMTGGNHDHILVKAGQYFDQPSWTINALGYGQAGIHYVDYKKVHQWSGFQFSHKDTATFNQSGIIVHGHTHQLHIGSDRVCPGVFTQ
jgi:UDP-2,3-diacylglucosamine pyrophosphatase LpxH